MGHAGEGPRNLAHKLIASHLVEGTMKPGEEIALRIDQTLTQDATGTLVMLELEAMGLDRVRTEVSAQYVDHNLLQQDYRNADDHLFLESACRRFGIWYSRPGNGVSHPLHQERFGKPGRSLLGSDSHTCAAGAIGMLAMGAGGIEVALAMSGHPFHVEMPKVMGVHVTGELPEWVSAKDVILEMLRRHGVDGGLGRIIEYHGAGLESLSAMDRHVIANMGAELGATTSVFPSDEITRRFLRSQRREQDWIAMHADVDATYDETDSIDLGSLEPLIALPSSPGNVRRVRELAGEPIYQAYIGSSANPAFRDFAIAAEIVRDKSVNPRVSFDINPTSRQILENLVNAGHVNILLHAGARLHQAGCNGCIGMGQAPASNRISLRTVPRNFPGRSGTTDDQVYLVSPETAAASALHGQITDPRTLERPAPQVADPVQPQLNHKMWQAPPAGHITQRPQLEKGPNIQSLPEMEALPDNLDLTVQLKLGDDVSTDEIMPAGSRVLPYRSNIPKIAEFVFENVDGQYVQRASQCRSEGGHCIVAGDNYGQGSSREHAALAPRFLGLRIVLAKSFARIHWQNLISFGILPLEFENNDEYEAIRQQDRITITGLRHQLRIGRLVSVEVGERSVRMRHRLSSRQFSVLHAGGVIPWLRDAHSSAD